MLGIPENEEQKCLSGLKPPSGEDIYEYPYHIEQSNWFKTIPYGFRVVKSKNEEGALSKFPSPMDFLHGAIGDNNCSYYFPVNPESISISTPFAVQVTPTLGGVVEEHSGAVFYNITVSGTTGIIPEINITSGIPRLAEEELRNCAYNPSWLDKMQAKAGFGSATYNAVNSSIAAVKKLSSQLLGIPIDNKTVDDGKDYKSGYTAYHILYKFIWLYHLDKSQGKKIELKFVNYKDNNQYNVVVQNFQLSRDKSKPHLYTYTIQMKGWLLETETEQTIVNPFFSGIMMKLRLASLGLDEGPSFKSTAFRVINTTKSLLNTSKNLLNTVAQDLAF